MPKVLDPSILDEIFRVSSKESVDMARRLAKEEGLLCGISSGAAVVAAIRSAVFLESFRQQAQCSRLLLNLRLQSMRCFWSRAH